MGIFSNQLLNVIEWDEQEEGVLFWKWQNDEIKKGSRLIIRPGQDAIFLHNGKVEGVFKEEGSYDIETDIIPFLSTLAGFKFGFNSGIRAEVVFINTKEILCKWGTKNAINIPAQGLPGGMPIRAFGTFNCHVAEHQRVIEKLAGTMATYTVEDVKTRIIASLDQLFMSWIVKEGKDMFNLQADAPGIAKGMESELDQEMQGIGIGITDFTIESFNYPEEVRKMQEKAAAQAMVGDVSKYQQIAAADSMSNGTGGTGVAADMVGIQMGMAMGQQMVNQMTQAGQMNTGAQTAVNVGAGVMAGQAATGAAGTTPKFCPNCGTATNGANFCMNCGTKLV